jgi:hypothetical protein
MSNGRYIALNRSASASSSAGPALAHARPPAGRRRGGAGAHLVGEADALQVLLGVEALADGLLEL